MARLCSDPEARIAALAMLGRGEATPGEIATMAGVSRQVVEMWAKRAGIDWKRVREGRLANQWRKDLGRGKRLVEAAKARSDEPGKAGRHRLSRSDRARVRSRLPG